MLVITRKCGESVIIEPGQGVEPIEIKIISADGGVKVGVSAPKECKIWRDELYRTIETNRKAAGAPVTDLKNLAGQLRGIKENQAKATEGGRAVFYDSNNFKVLEAGISLAQLQQQLSSQNIANSETAGYKSKNLSFKSVLKDAEDGTGSSEIERIDAEIETSEETSARADGNNVDSEKEYLTLYKTYAQYSMLLERLKGEFDKYDSVLNANL